VHVSETEPLLVILDYKFFCSNSQNARKAQEITWCLYFRLWSGMTISVRGFRLLCKQCLRAELSKSPWSKQNVKNTYIGPTTSSETQGLLIETMRFFWVTDIFGRTLTSSEEEGLIRAWSKLSPENIVSRKYRIVPTSSPWVSEDSPTTAWGPPREEEDFSRTWLMKAWAFMDRDKSRGDTLVTDTLGWT